MNEYIPCLWKERIILSNNLYRFNFNDCGFDTHSASILPHPYFGMYSPYTRLLTLSKGKEIVNSTFFFGRIHGVSKIRNILSCKCDTNIWFFQCFSFVHWQAASPVSCQVSFLWWSLMNICYAYNSGEFIYITATFILTIKKKSLIHTASTG